MYGVPYEYTHMTHPMPIYVYGAEHRHLIRKYKQCLTSQSSYFAILNYSHENVSLWYVFSYFHENISCDAWKRSETCFVFNLKLTCLWGMWMSVMEGCCRQIRMLWWWRRIRLSPLAIFLRNFMGLQRICSVKGRDMNYNYLNCMYIKISCDTEMIQVTNKLLCNTSFNIVNWV